MQITFFKLIQFYINIKNLFSFYDPYHKCTKL